MEKNNQKKDPFRDKIIQTLAKCDDFGDPDKLYEELMGFKENVLKDKEKYDLSTILEALGNKDRFIIIDALRKKDRCVCELEAILQKSQATVSHHLKILRDVRLIYGWPKGKFTHYSLIENTFSRLQDIFSNWIQPITNWYNAENIFNSQNSE